MKIVCGAIESGESEHASRHVLDRRPNTVTQELNREKKVGTRE